MAEAKFKRGSASNLASLAKEDGSVIFAVKDASSPTTLVFDKAINGTVQRLGVAVDKAKSADSASVASTANVAKLISPFENATANASRNVWFSDSEKRNKPVYNDNFKYNPVSQILTTNISGSAAKWATARTVTLNGDLSGSFSIDGSGNVSANIYDYYSTVYVGNTNNYPYHRIAKLDTISSSYVDKSTLLYLSQGYQGGCFGIIRVTLRTNNVSGGAKSGVEARWLIRSGFNINDIKIGHYSVAGKTYADVFYRSNSAYAGCVIRDLGSGSRGNIGRCWTLVNSRETENTTTSDKKTSFECWATIELAGKDLHNQAYSEIISSSDGGTVAYANNSGALGGSSLSQVLASAGGGKFLPLAGGTMTGTIIAAIGNQKGIKIGNQWITSASNTNGEVVLQGGHLRFGTTAWDYNQWAGLKYNHSNKGIYLGIADGSQFTANSPQSGGSIYTPGIDNIYVGASTSQKVLTTSNYTSTTDGRYVKKAGDTMSGNLLFSNSGTAFRGIQGQVGDNDYWRVMGSATGSNAGFLEIATGDDSNEPIYARQYSGAFATLKRTLTLMDASGHTRLYGNLLLNRSGGASLGRIGYYSPSYYTWFSYMSNPAGGAAPTGGMPSTYNNVTSWAQRSLIENASGYGWIWESASNASAAANVMPTPMMSLSSNNGNLAVRGTVISPYFNGLAKNSNALGGSSLSQILTASGGGNSFTAIDTATNNTIKLTRANGGTVQKIINNVSNAGTASYSDKTKFIMSSDTRSVNAPPSSYMGSGILGSKEEFKQNSTIGTSYLGGTYSHLITHTPWPDSAGGLPYQIAYGANGIMRRAGSSASAWSNWYIMLDTRNYTSYAADRTAFTGAAVSGRNVTFTRANGGTTSITTQDTTYPVYGKTINAGFSTAFRTQTFGSTASGWRLSAIRNNTAGVSNAPQHGSGMAWANADTHGYLYTSYSSPQAFIGGGNGDRLNWIKELAFTDTKMATASTADYAKTLEGHPASYFAIATGTSSNVVENGMYLLSNTSQVNNRFSVKNGQLTSGNTNFPSNLLLAAASTDYPQLTGDSSGTTKNYSILHFGDSAYRHDIVMACDGANTGIIYAFATTANTGGRLARVMDSLNYSGYMYRFDNQITFSKGLIANSPSSTVLIDGGSY